MRTSTEFIAFAEANYENAIMSLLEGLGYTRCYGPCITRDFHNPLYMNALAKSLPRINPDAACAALKEALDKITRPESGTLVQRNKWFTDALQNGLEVSYRAAGETKHELIRLVDFAAPENNAFHAVNQWTVVENETRRADVVVFVNGLPLAVAELKSCMREGVDIANGYRQLRTYMREIPSLFAYNAFCIISDLAHSRAGTITSGFDRFADWKTLDGNYAETKYARYDVLFEGLLRPARLLDIVKHFMLFSRDTPEDKKILAGYHQYFAVKKAVESTLRAAGYEQSPVRAAEFGGEKQQKKIAPCALAYLSAAGSGKGGVFWHTQGSGKSLSMVFYAALLRERMNSPTVVVITDRNDLDDQLYEQFAACKDFLRQTPEHAADRKHLRALLDGRQANGIFFTTVQKFEDYDAPLSLRRNIVVIADEAHRSQYGLAEKVTKDGRVTAGIARTIRDSLPNATFIGFTGTPVSSEDKNTREVFGDYIDVYDMTQSVEDGATRPVYYENRVINLGLDRDVLQKIDETYELLALSADEKDVERSKRELGNMEAILGASQTVDSLCRDIIAHYEENRANLLTGKALIVAYSRKIARAVYRRILELRPAWYEKVHVVMTGNVDDPEDWQALIGNKAHKKELAQKFKNDDDPFKIAIVVDMWLTGFDVPSLATMYVYKAMNGHNLMQAIARVNRVFRDKEGGLVVDYVGVARALKQAMNDYTVRDRANYGEMNIADTALPKFAEKLRVCGELFHGFDYAAFLADAADDSSRAAAIAGGIDFMLSKNEAAQKLFREESLLLRKAKTLCQSLLNKTQRMEAAYFEAVRTALSHISEPKKLSFREINEHINELLRQSIQSEGVFSLFADKAESFSLFDPAFLEEIARMKEKNLAAELLRRLVAEQISLYQRTNLVQAQRFSERMQKLMNSYRNGLISNAEVIDELRNMARDIADAHKKGDALGLTPEEAAFYDALTKPEAIKAFYTNDELREMTRELTDTLRKSRTIDWNKKAGARAGMRRLVKRLLRKYKYPPEGVEDAVSTVLAQCELWADC